VSGQLKVAPEHISDAVLSMMGKPENAVYEKFIARYKKTNEEVGKKQFVVPYLMSSHPGSTMKEAVALAEYLRDIGYMPEQVQDFYPTPSTVSTCMYYTGIDPRTMKPVYVPKSPHEKAMQRALIQYRNPKNYNLVVEALTLANRTDLIGYDKLCLIRPNYMDKDKFGSKPSETGKNSVRKGSGRGTANSGNVRGTANQADGKEKNGSSKGSKGARGGFGSKTGRSAQSSELNRFEGRKAENKNSGKKIRNTHKKK